MFFSPKLILVKLESEILQRVLRFFNIPAHISAGQRCTLSSVPPRPHTGARSGEEARRALKGGLSTKGTSPPRAGGRQGLKSDAFLSCGARTLEPAGSRVTIVGDEAFPLELIRLN